MITTLNAARDPGDVAVIISVALFSAPTRQ